MTGSESDGSGNTEETAVLTEQQQTAAHSSDYRDMTQTDLSPAAALGNAQLTLTPSPADKVTAPEPETSETTKPGKNTPVTAAATTAKTAAAPTSATAASTAAQPAATQPAATQPAATQSAATQPAATTAAPAEAGGSLDTSMAYAVLDYSNKQRASALSWSDTLAGIAQTRAKELATSFSHTRPDGSSCWMSDCQLAENIAKGQCSAEAVVSSWMASSGHAANITNAGYTQMGVGCYYSNGVYYWAQEFG